MAALQKRRRFGLDSQRRNALVWLALFHRDWGDAMARERSTEWMPPTVHRLGGPEHDMPLPYNVPRLDTFLQGKTRLRAALETVVTIAILLLLAIAFGLLRLHLYWPVDAPRPF